MVGLGGRCVALCRGPSGSGGLGGLELGRISNAEIIADLEWAVWNLGG